MKLLTYVACSTIIVAYACAARLPLDQDRDLVILEKEDDRTGTQQWQIQTRYAEGGPRMPLGLPSFAVDVVAISLGAADEEAEYPTGFLLRLHSKDWGWRFLRAREITLTLDGAEQIELGEGLYRGGLHSDRALEGQFHTEMLAAPIAREELERVAGARMAAVAVGDFRFRIHSSTIEAIQRLLTTVPASVM